MIGMSRVRRVPVTYSIRDQTMVGTMHVPPSDGSAGSNRIALVLLNSGPAPRAGNSDLSAYLTERLSERGVLSFRFDLPGLGDSTGPSWRDISSFWHAAQRGFNDAAVVGLVNDLCQRYELRGVILGGLCAGAIASVRAAESLDGRLLGLVLLEPNFRASPDVDSIPGEAVVGAAPAASRVRRTRRAMSRIRNLDELLYALTGSSRYARLLRPIRPLLERLIERRLGRELPCDVLMDTVSTWRRLVSDGIPSLVVLAQDLGVDRYVERIIRTFPPADRNVVRTVLVPDSNHLLIGGDGRRRTGEALYAWVAERFPD